MDEYGIAGIEIDNDDGDDVLKEYTFRVKNNGIKVIRYSDDGYENRLANNFVYRVANVAGVC